MTRPAINRASTGATQALYLVALGLFLPPAYAQGLDAMGSRVETLSNLVNLLIMAVAGISTSICMLLIAAAIILFFRRHGVLGGKLLLGAFAAPVIGAAARYFLNCVAMLGQGAEPVMWGATMGGWATVILLSLVTGMSPTIVAFKRDLRSWKKYLAVNLVVIGLPICLRLLAPGADLLPSLIYLALPIMLALALVGKNPAVPAGEAAAEITTPPTEGTVAAAPAEEEAKGAQSTVAAAPAEEEAKGAQSTVAAAPAEEEAKADAQKQAPSEPSEPAPKEPGSLPD